MTEAIAILLLVVLLWVVAGATTIVLHRRALRERQRRELDMPASERYRREYVRTGSELALRNMQKALEEEEHRKWAGS